MGVLSLKRGSLVGVTVWISCLLLCFLLGKQLFGEFWLLVSIWVFAAGSLLLFPKPAFRVGMYMALFFSMLLLYLPVSAHRFIEDMDNRVRNLFFKIRGPIEHTDNVILVDIDQKTLDLLGQWPLPRSAFARGIKHIKEDGCQVLGLDIIFPEEDRFSLQNTLKKVESLGGKPAFPKTEFVWNDLEQIVLKEWADRLQVEMEGKEPVTTAYQKWRHHNWLEEERVLKQRYKRAGRAFLTREYKKALDPFYEMMHQTESLYSIDWSRGRERAALILDNDAYLGRELDDLRVVAGGLILTHNIEGETTSVFVQDTHLEETEGMVVSAGVFEVNSVFPAIPLGFRQITNNSKVQSQLQNQGIFNLLPDQSGAARYYVALMQAPVFQKSLVLKPSIVSQKSTGFDLNNFDTKIVSKIYTYPGLALEMFRVAKGYEQVVPIVKRWGRGLSLQSEKIEENYFVPLNHHAQLPINFLGYGGPWQPESKYGPECYFRYISFADVLQKRFDPGTFKGRAVLVGSSDPTLSDLVGSPFRSGFPGLEVHATVLENLITNNVLFDAREFLRIYFFLAILLIGMGFVIFLVYSPLWIGITVSFALVIGIPFFSYFLFSQHNIIIDFMYPWLACFPILSGVVAQNTLSEGKERRFVAEQFSKMVSADVLKKLKDDAKGISLEGQRLEVTVMFCDLVGFTKLSEKIEAQTAVEILNQYFQFMAKEILKEKGFIDKFMGDGLMACWGAPYAVEDHAIKACYVALRQREQVIKQRNYFRKKYGFELKIGMGISTGLVAAACIGSKERRNYTVIGDAVNLGARLESASRSYGTEILVGENTYHRAREVFEFRLLDRLVVLGKSQPIEVYGLLGFKGKCSEQELQSKRNYEKGLKLHWERRWDEALACLDEEDQASCNLITRIQEYQKNPPTDDWRGEHMLTTK